MVNIGTDIYVILEEIMNDKGLSVADVARLCDLPDSTVRAIIKRKSKTVAIDVAFKLSKGLDVTLEKLNGMQEPVERIETLSCSSLSVEACHVGTLYDLAVEDDKIAVEHILKKYDTSKSNSNLNARKSEEKVV